MKDATPRTLKRGALQLCKLLCQLEPILNHSFELKSIPTGYLELLEYRVYILEKLAEATQAQANLGLTSPELTRIFSDIRNTLNREYRI